MADSEQDRLVLAALSAVQGFGVKTLDRLQSWRLEKNLSWLELWQQQPNQLGQLGVLEKKQVQALTAFQAKWTLAKYKKKLDQANIQIIVRVDEKYPPLLKEIADPPWVLYVRGSYQVSKLSIAVVGTRSATAYGRYATGLLVKQLVAKGAEIVSGGMSGIDAQAHRTALAEAGRTTAVLGYGFDYVYPVEQKDLLQAIIRQGGCLMSEYAPWVKPARGQFVQRNRIVSGLAQALLVIEAGMKSGTHHTVDFALDQGRDIYAVPGPISSPFSEGTKLLVNQGAKLVSSWRDIDVDWPQVSMAGHSTESAIIFQLKGGPATTSQLMEQLQKTFSELAGSLSKLQATEKIKNEAGLWFWVGI